VTAWLIDVELCDVWIVYGEIPPGYVSLEVAVPAELVDRGLVLAAAGLMVLGLEAPIIGEPADTAALTGARLPVAATGELVVVKFIALALAGVTLDVTWGPRPGPH